MGVRAVVIAVDKHRATVLVAGGQFKRVKLNQKKLVVGQEIDLSTLQNFQPVKRALGAITALASIIMGLNAYLSQPSPLATAVLSIDIKPSINMVVGGSAPVVLQTSALDPSGKKLLQQISLQGLPIRQALDKVTRWAQRDGYLTAKRSYVVLGAVSHTSHFGWFSKLCYAERKLLSGHGAWHGQLISVTMVTHKTLRHFADRDVSVGRYLLWKEDQGSIPPSSVSYRKLQQSPLSVLLKRKLHPPRPLPISPIKASAKPLFRSHDPVPLVTRSSPSGPRILPPSPRPPLSTASVRNGADLGCTHGSPHHSGVAGTKGITMANGGAPHLMKKKRPFGAAPVVNMRVFHHLH
jgi:hypothetical protein